MKKLFGLLPICFVLLAIISCSGLNESSSLSLTFNGSDFVQNTSARNISVSSEYEGYYIVASVLGDYTETKSLQITSGGTYTIEFNSVPVGANIYVEANVYNPNCNEEYNYCHIFTGTSAKQKVAAGENTVNLVMKKLTENLTGAYETTVSGRSAELPDGTSLDNAPDLTLYKNGKYKLAMGNSIYSEGLWRCSVLDDNGLPAVNGGAACTLYLTECIYFNVSANTPGDSGGSQLTNCVIIERPTEKSFSKTEGTFMFDFKSESGVVFGLGWA